MQEETLNTVESLRQALADLGLFTGGKKSKLKKRLEKAKKKREQLSEEQESEVIAESPNESLSDLSNEEQSKSKKQPFDYYLFFDVEATCEENGGFDYPNEIIEFPVVLVDGLTFKKVDEFQSYVKPSKHPELTDFCKKLTGITQETVDESPSFVDVLDEFQAFMTKYALFQDCSAVFVTAPFSYVRTCGWALFSQKDGPFDIRDFVTKQCTHSKIKLPLYFQQPWINIRKLYKDFYKSERSKNISQMLEALGMSFEGHQHSGLDDARNLWRIGQRMYDDGCVFKTNMYWGHRMRTFQRKSRKGK
ncbi:ribonuclease H-like domain-containing protein [Dichotomocladium elegans]|nr:ribonuclease H-like domain-containing protein [Dichotomocladium elegans]